MNIHMCVSIRGILNNYKTDKQLAKFFKNCVTDKNGKIVNDGYEIRQHFYDELIKGREVLPMGKCDNFDYKEGCLGHIQPDDTELTKASYPRAK
jgi:hypothetical protein